jgi:hypothetical protein
MLASAGIFQLISQGRGRCRTPVTLLLEIEYEIEKGHVRNIKVNTHQEEQGRNGQ